MKKFLAYTIPVILSLAIGALGSYVQSPSISSWYPTLIKSQLTPPAVVFPIAWTVLYILMGLSIGRLVALGDMSVVRLWLMQLLVNFLWSVSFFSLRSPLLGLITILILVVLVFAYTIYSFSIDRIAGWLFIPYLLWLLFATYLTGYIYLNNPTTSTLSAANAPQSSITIPQSSNIYTVPALPYLSGALEPVMSSETIEYHYGKHLKGYADNLNRLIVGTPYEGMALEQVVTSTDGAIFNNAAQMLNHIIFFEGMTPEVVDIPKRLESAIVRDFGSVELFKEQFTDAAKSLFGSGWVWLVEDNYGRLSIVTTQNADNPICQGLNPLLVLDVWEHAYYIDYRNRRSDFIDGWWGIVDWQKAEKRAKFSPSPEF
ncbi:MAG: tryptophan-rich sensory protein [Alistipes sp.]|nr:tryptophan-rich sensory protein [Alistipes sp.]